MGEEKGPMRLPNWPLLLSVSCVAGGSLAPPNWLVVIYGAGNRDTQSSHVASACISLRLRLHEKYWGQHLSLRDVPTSPQGQKPHSIQLTSSADFSEGWMVSADEALRPFSAPLQKKSHLVFNFDSLIHMGQWQNFYHLIPALSKVQSHLWFDDQGILQYFPSPQCPVSFSAFWLIFRALSWETE